jgi:hypothetical protein
MACAGLGLLAVNGVADTDGLIGFAVVLPILAVLIGGIGGARRPASGTFSAERGGKSLRAP